MHVVVLGAGLLGVTTAHYLAREGHQVTVIDRQKEPARETSFANAGLLTPGHAYAWASPRAPMILLKSLWRSDTALRWRLKFDPGMWAWGLKFLANCTAERNRANTVIKVRLCSYSLAQTAEVTAETGITWDRSRSGALYLYRDPDHFRAGRANFKLLADEGVEAKLRSSFASQGKSIGELETNLQQFSFFDTLPEKAQEALLAGAVDESKEADEEFSGMLKAWSNGDVKAIARTFDRDLAGSPELAQALIHRRNANWSRWIEQRMAQPGALMIAVGAGHLAGKDSVIAMLQRQGYRVRRVQ